MKKFIIFAFLLLITAFLPVIATQETPEKGRFLIEIEQDNKPVVVVNNVCRLKKEPFTIVVKLQQLEGVLIHADFSNTSYNQALANKPISKIAGFKSTGLAADKKNPDKDIMLSDNAPNYWYYENPEEHRFDQITTENGWTVCRREIANLYDVKTSKLSELATAKQNLHLVFMHAKYDLENDKRIEYQRLPLKIEWVN